MNNLTLGQYYACDSLIHRLDPRTKFITLVLLIVTITVQHELYVLIGLFGFFSVIMGLSRVPPPVFFRQLRLFILIITLTFVLHAFITSGTAIFIVPLLGLDVTHEGISVGFYFGFRLFLAIAYSILFMFTTTPAQMTDGMEKLLRPLKKIGLHVDSYALMLGITLRFIPVLFEESDRIRKAQLARGARFEGSLASKLYALKSVVIPLFISVFKRADTLTRALEARGFPGKKRTYYKDLRFSFGDTFAFIVVFLISAGAFVL